MLLHLFTVYHLPFTIFSRFALCAMPYAKMTAKRNLSRLAVTKVGSKG
jgi:hypothetical protein